MAKDRTRHARRREPERRHESPLDRAARETAQALASFGDGMARALVGFADSVSSTVSDWVEMYRRLTNGSD